MKIKISTNINKKMVKPKPLTLDEKKEIVSSELEVIKSKLKNQTYQAFKRKIDKSKARGLTLLSKNFKTIFDTDTDIKKLTLKTLKDSVIQYTLVGTSYEIKIDPILNTITLKNGESIKLIIPSKKNIVLKREFAVADGDFSKIRQLLSMPVVDEIGAFKYINNKQVINAFVTQGAGSKKVTVFRELNSKIIFYKKTDLAKIKLYNTIDNLPYKEFNGFRDTGSLKCVPETILHHLKVSGRNKKLTEDDLINDLKYLQNERLQTDLGFTTETIVKLLEKYNCRARFLDINLQQFLATDNFAEKDYDKHLKTFIGIVYGKHLYYCDDAKFVKSISEKCKKEQTGYFDTNKYEKTNDKKEYSSYEIHEADNINDVYINNYMKDNTINKVKTLNGVITNIITQDNTLISSNPEKSIMKEILGDNFKNENTTMLGREELELFLKENEIVIPKSSFSPEVLIKIGKHGNIVGDYNEPSSCNVTGYDINKCRTACLRNNVLGDYEIFGIECDIKPYTGGMKPGYYFIETTDIEFFMKGNGWYSMDYLLYAEKEGYTFKPIYELNASGSFAGDLFKDFVDEVVKKYTTTFKHIINKLIGQFGKTISKSSSGYIETDKDMAINAFWDYNKNGIGFSTDEDIPNKVVKKLKGSLCNIQHLDLPNGKTHYIVEQTKQKALYDNHLPIYNKVLENEFIRVYELKKKLGGKVIRIRTDCVYVENNNLINTGVGLGEYKKEETEICDVNINDIKNKTCEEPKKLTWKVIDETTDMIMPNGSYLITGLAGYGKTYLAKQQKEYTEDTTIRLAFTNVSCENLKQDDIVCNTLNSYFGIDITTRKCSEKRINNLKNIKCIMITEAFMIPSYIMSVLIKIKITYPDIKWIIEGDPEQTRPVGQENVNWLETKCFYDICNGTLIKLNKNKRNNECVNYNKIFKNKKLPEFNYEVRQPQNINICRTNETRCNINELKMNKTGYYIEYNSEKHYEKGQNVYLTLDTPIMCVLNNKKTEIYNGKMYPINSIKENKIVINDIEYTDETFMKNFVVAYCVTNHKVQGITIKEPYNIYDWNKMTIREKYTAYSRCGEGSLVRII